MSMKQELETWVTALSLYDAQDFEESINAFQPIADTSKILFNCGIIRATLGEHEAAVQYFQKATRLDLYLAVAYFQQGVSSFLIGDFEEALANFNDTLLYLRGNKLINYEQLGLRYQLHSCEALFNRGLCYIYLQQVEAGLADMEFAAKEKATPEHNVIDDAIRERAEGYTVFSIPVGVVFRPNEAKVKNVRARDYLGKARLVAQAPDLPLGHRKKLSAEIWAQDDRPAGSISYAATHLIRPGLASRSRQQSEPPLQRNLFPPTPPPEAEKPRPERQHSPTSGSGRSQSLSRRPEPLNLGVAAFEHSTSKAQNSVLQQRPKPPRWASERPVDRRPYLDRNSSGELAPREHLFGAIDNEGQQAEVAASKQQGQRTSHSRSHYRSLWHNRAEFIEETEEEHSGRSTVPEIRDDVSDNRSTHTRSTYSSSRRTAALMSKIRVKVHHEDDTRFIFLAPGATLSGLSDQLAKKFAFQKPMRIKMRDEDGDMITLADQDDLDMALSICKEAAFKSGSDMGKLELWIQLVEASTR